MSRGDSAVHELTKLLRAVVSRTVFPTTPQRVDYELTKLGSSLWEAVEPLGSWARAHVIEILASREHFDEKDAK